MLTQLIEQYQYKAVSLSLLKEEGLLERVVLAIDEINALKQSVTREAVAKIVGIPRSTLKRYPRIESLLNKEKEREVQRHEVEMLARVEMAIKHLEEHAQSVTHLSIAREVGLKLATLHHYPQVIDLVQRIVKEKKQVIAIKRFQMREKELLFEVSNALQQLRQLKQLICASSIARMISVDVSVLTHYPKVKRMVEIAILEYKQAKGKNEDEV